MKRILLLFAITIILTTASLVSADTSAPQKIRIAAFNFYPTLFQDKDGSVQGFYADFLSEIAKRENWTIEYVYGNWADGLSRIKSGEVDVLTNVALTADRTQFMDYGKVPLLTVWAELYAPSGSPIDSIRDVQNKKIALMKGDFNAANFKNLVEKFSIPCTYVEYGNFEEVFKAISARQVDAGIVNNTFGTAKQAEYDLKSTGVIFNPFDIFFTVANGKNSAVLATLDRYLEEWRKNESSPYHQARERWSHKSASTIRVVHPWLKKAAVITGMMLCVAVGFVLLLRIQVRRKTAEILKYSDELHLATRQLEDELAERQAAQEALQEQTVVLEEEIADRKQIENELRDAEWKFRALFDNGPIGVAYHSIIYDESGSPVDYLFIDANDNYLKLTGVDPRGKTVTQAFPGIEKDPFNWIGVFGHVAKSGETVHFLQHLQSNDRWYDVVGYQYKPDHFVASFVEITDRKKAEESLRVSEERFRSYVDLSPTAIFIADENGYYVDVNPAASIITGFTADELLTMKIPDLLPPESLEWAQNNFLQLVETGRSNGESAFRRKNGEIGYWSLSAVKLSSTRYMAIVTDISDRKRLEEEHKELENQIIHAQKMESLGVLAGGIAHDFNNILAIIMGNCSLAKMDAENAGNYIPEIEKASDRAAALCRQMLAYAGKATLTQTQVNMWLLIDEMINMLKATIPQNTVIKPNLSPDTAFITGDASQIKQIAMNLIINASEAIGEAQGEIQVSLSKALITKNQPVKDHQGKDIPPGEYVCLEVTDNGCGMDEETKWRIFEPFYTTKFTGRGLGMSAVLGIISAHNGALQLYSQPGLGTTFRVYLPSESAAVELSVEIAPSLPWQGSGTILLVEDEESIRTVVQCMLEMLGFTVIEACDGKEALALYQQNTTNITLVVTDMGLPIMDGYTLFKELKKLTPKLPIIISSGFGDSVVTSRIAPVDIAGLVSKPYNFNQLRDVLRKVVEGEKLN